ncbi:hypothetical protein BT69DRAFT_821927 [Atractiella rhizophila]|nr:hypothetical protein BT69DRAFT_821927 [Atractiella rhizophila]
MRYSRSVKDETYSLRWVNPTPGGDSKHGTPNASYCRFKLQVLLLSYHPVSEHETARSFNNPSRTHATALITIPVGGYKTLPIFQRELHFVIRCAGVPFFMGLSYSIQACIAVALLLDGFGT